VLEIVVGRVIPQIRDGILFLFMLPTTNLIIHRCIICNDFVRRSDVD
jgi:hypothetical protein